MTINEVFLSKYIYTLRHCPAAVKFMELPLLLQLLSCRALVPHPDYVQDMPLF